MPFVGDQHTNIQKIVDNGVGLLLDFNTIDKATFKQAILEVMENPRCGLQSIIVFLLSFFLNLFVLAMVPKQEN